MEANQEIFMEFMNNQEFKAVVFEELLSIIHNTIKDVA
jgi:hypothetical protein